MLDTTVITALTPELTDRVTIKHSLEENLTGDIKKTWFTLQNSAKVMLEDLPAKFYSEGTVVTRSELPFSVLESARVIIMGCLDTITESNKVIVKHPHNNNSRNFRIKGIVMNTNLLTVLEVEAVGV